METRHGLSTRCSACYHGFPSPYPSYPCFLRIPLSVCLCSLLSFPFSFLLFQAFMCGRVYVYVCVCVHTHTLRQQLSLCPQGRGLLRFTCMAEGIYECEVLGICGSGVAELVMLRRVARLRSFFLGLASVCVGMHECMCGFRKSVLCV
ncbi:hypothetical protein K491DRAFT_216746 [Lophiostoma macrostomum CBS 122681]|uniref:Uncharacterized protein n=1 Tax=Lophiostoma macrostomum CBS 122681 TaxID=1314788 RepID=A0A6A6THG2_9PLEO|nr:hypothetical protein K491DRAFT_216746 [Lophiostoma macrostomum CBS 122681]